MKRHISCLLFWCLIAGPVTAQIYLPVKMGGRWGLIDSSGKVLITPQYDNIEDVPEWPRLKFAFLDGKSMLIDIHNNRMSASWHEQMIPLGDSAFLTINGSKKGVISLEGKQLLSNSYNKIIYLQRRYFLATNGENKLELFDRKGNAMLGRSFDSLSANDNFIAGFGSDSTFIYNNSGILINSGQYGQVKFAYPFAALYSKERDKFVIINYSGEQVIQDVFTSWDLADARFIIAAGRQNYLLFRKGSVSPIPVDKHNDRRITMCDTTYYLELELTGGRSAVYSDYGSTFDLEQLTNLFYCSGSYLVNNKGELKGLHHRNGKMILSAAWTEIMPMANSLIKVRNGSKYGLYNSEGKELLPAIYDGIEDAENMIKAYRDTRAIILLLDEQANVIERQQLNDLTALNVRDKVVYFTASAAGSAAAAVPATSNASGIVADQGNWRYHTTKKLWGYQRKDTFIIKPSFKYIERSLNYGVTRVVNEGKKTGLVSDSTGRFIHQCGYDNIFSNDMDATSGILMRAMNTKGMYVIRTNGGKFRRTFTYISEYSQGMARYNYGGRFISRKDVLPSHADLNMNGINLTNYSLAEKGCSNGSKNLSIEGGKWGFLNAEGKPERDTMYDWVTDFSGGISFVKLRGKWGYLTLTKKEVSPQYDEIGFLPGSAQRKIQISNRIDRFCYVDNKGRSVTAPVYSDAFPFRGGIALVKRDGLFYYINTESEEINKTGYENAKEFDNGFAAVKVGKHWGLIDVAGNEVLPPVYSKIGRISENRVEVFRGLWGYVSTEGEKELRCTYQAVKPFSGGRAWVKTKGKWGMINTEGDFIVKPRYRQVKYSVETGVFYASKRKNWEMLDTEGRKMFRKKFRSIMDFSEGVAILSKGRKHYLKKNDGSKHHTVKAGSIQAFSCGLAVARRRGLYGAVDGSGKIRIPFKYQKLESFSEGLAVYIPVQKYKTIRYGYIDTEGNSVLGDNYRFAGPLKSGWAMVKESDGVFRYINKKGLLISTENNAAVRNFTDSIGAVRGQDGKIALVNAEGVLISTFRFAGITGISESIAVVKIDKLQGLAGNDGKVYFEPEFENIKPVSDRIYRIERGSEIGYYHVDLGWIWELTQ